MGGVDEASVDATAGALPFSLLASRQHVRASNSRRPSGGLITVEGRALTVARRQEPLAGVQMFLKNS